MELHVKILAAFHLVFGALGLIGALTILLVFGGAAGVVGTSATNNPDAWVAVPILGIVGSALVLVLVTLSLPGIIAGLGLIKLRPWARILAIVLSVLNLINIPIGTLLGIYGLWVLCSRETERLFTAPRPTGSAAP